MFDSTVIEKIKNGGIGVIPTDTMYGMVGSALNAEVVEKIFALRKRNLEKPLVVVVSSIKDIKKFNLELSLDLENILEKIWPGPVSVEIPVTDEKWKHLTRGAGHFAMRLPASEALRKLIEKTGPLVAPSVNTEGNLPAETVEEARGYFPNLDFYVEGGVLPNNPSTLISIEEGKAKVWRQGAWQVPDFLS